MSDLYFDGYQHKLTHFTKDVTPNGDGWYANNVVARSVGPVNGFHVQGVA